MSRSVKGKFLIAAISISTAVAILLGRAQAGAPWQNSPTQENQQRLAAILRKSKDYCQRLEKAALDFVCREEASERFDHTREINQDLLFVGPTGGYIGTETVQMAPQRTGRNTYLYDYQFIRKNRETKERRNLLEVNGKKKNIQDSGLGTTQFQYGNILFGPIGLLSESWQPYHDYQLVGEEIINGEKSVAIEATPKPSLNKSHCYGRIWVKEDDGSILKIVWDQESIGNYNNIEAWAKRYGAEPQITSLSEYGVEKNSLRFPSRDYTEEAYVKKDGKKFVRAETTIVYRDYKFFTVETEIKY